MARKRKKNLTPEHRLSIDRTRAAEREKLEADREMLKLKAAAIAERWSQIVADLNHRDLGEIGEWIVDNAVNGEAYEVYEVDSGYDVSTNSQATGRHHKLTDYETVEQFLGTPNGQTVATYVSGSGLAADTLLTDFESFCGDFLAGWIASQPETKEVNPDLMWDLRELIDTECERIGLCYIMGLLDFLPLRLDDVMRQWPVEPVPETSLLPGEDPELPVGLATLLDRFPRDLKDHHLTFVTPTGTATFARDNSCHLAEWWRREAIRLVYTPGRSTVLNRRVFTAMRDVGSNLPIKKISSCILHSGGIDPLDAETTKHAFNTDHATGQALEPMPATIYESF